MHLESLIGRRFAIDHRYAKWDDFIPNDYMRATLKAGRIPLINWNSAKRRHGHVTWRKIARGEEDRAIRARARAFRRLGSRVMVAFHHEPEYRRARYGTTAEYRAAWRHIVRVFRQERATNVEWVWIMMAASFRSSAATHASAYYPGDDIIDWIAADGYNWHGSDHVVGSPWRSFGTVFKSFYDWGAARGKPLMIAEFGSLEDVSTPDPLRKARWLQDLRTTLASWPQLKALVYYNARGWWFDSSPETLEAFRQLAADPYLNPTTPRRKPIETGKPTVEIVAPDPESELTRGSVVTIEAHASDRQGIKRVVFWVNGRHRCSDTTAPYHCDWTVHTRPGFRNTLRVVAHDNRGSTRWFVIRILTA